jgi:hypothetical protein
MDGVLDRAKGLEGLPRGMVAECENSGNLRWLRGFDSREG